MRIETPRLTRTGGCPSSSVSTAYWRDDWFRPWFCADRLCEVFGSALNAAIAIRVVATSRKRVGATRFLYDHLTGDILKNDVEYYLCGEASDALEAAMGPNQRVVWVTVKVLEYAG